MSKSGRVTCVSHNVKEYDLDSLRKQVAMVLQYPFSGTIKRKYALEIRDATNEEDRRSL